MQHPGGKGLRSDESGLSIEWNEGDILQRELVDILCEIPITDTNIDKQPIQLDSTIDVIFKNGCDTKIV